VSQERPAIFATSLTGKRVHKAAKTLEETPRHAVAGHLEWNTLPVRAAATGHPVGIELEVGLQIAQRAVAEVHGIDLLVDPLSMLTANAALMRASAILEREYLDLAACTPAGHPDLHGQDSKTLHSQIRREMISRLPSGHLDPPSLVGRRILDRLGALLSSPLAAQTLKPSVSLKIDRRHK
jgi:hypothetical protein